MTKCQFSSDFSIHFLTFFIDILKNLGLTQKLVVSKFCTSCAYIGPSASVRSLVVKFSKKKFKFKIYGLKTTSDSNSEG